MRFKSQNCSSDKRGIHRDMKKMAFIDLSNFNDWPMGGMLEYELAILRKLVCFYEIELWGVSVDGVNPKPVLLGGKEYKVNVYANVHTKKKILPNYFKGLGILWNKEFRKQNYDCIYAHSGSSFVGAYILKHNEKCVFAYHQHGLSYRTNHAPMIMIQKPFYWISQRCADVVFVVSGDKSVEAFATEMRNKSKAHFVGVGSPIDLDKFDVDAIKKRIEINDKKHIHSFVYVGRISPEKNIASMIEAFSIYLKKTNKEAILNLIGDGPDREKIQSLVDNLGIRDSVIFHGRKNHEDIYNLIQTAETFLISSNGEGVSIAVLEAFASGLPVVSYDVPGLREQNKDKYTGAIAKSKTSESFADAMAYVDANKTQLSLNCLEEAKLYSDIKITEKIVRSIEKIKK